jgi:hypothetical protein
MEAKLENAVEKDPDLLEALATAFLQNFYQHIRLAETHDTNNKIFDTVLAELNRTYQSFLGGTGEAHLELAFRGEQIFVNRVRLRPKPRQFSTYRFILKFMRIRRIGSVLIKPFDRPEQLKSFLGLVSRARDLLGEDTEPAVQLMIDLKAAGLDSIFQVSSIQKLYIGSGAGGTPGENVADVEIAAAAIYESLRKFLDVILENLENAERFELNSLDHLMQDLMMLANEDIIQMLRLLSVKRYDRPLPYRGVNAAFLMNAWAESLKLPKGVVRELTELALIHPIVFRVVQNRSQTPSEVQEIELYVILQRIQSVFPLTSLQMLALVEWLTPFGQTGVYSIQQTQCYQHFFSRMLRIVASFEEMTTYEKSKRVYLPDEALAELLKRQDDCDPTLLKLFINWLGVYPLGSLVELSTGEIAQVFAGASDPLKFQRPIVLILKSSDGVVLDRPQIFDLSEMNEKLGVYRKSVKRSTTLEAAGLDPQRLRASPIAF